MAVVSSGRIGIKSDVVKEFGGGAPDRASEYYRAPGGVIPNTVTSSVVTPNYVPGNSVPGNDIMKPHTGKPCCKIPKGGACDPWKIKGCHCCTTDVNQWYCCYDKNPPTSNPGYWTTTTKQGTVTTNQGVPTSGTIKWKQWYGARKT